jgi:hypothetical protein
LTAVLEPLGVSYRRVGNVVIVGASSAASPTPAKVLAAAPSPSLKPAVVVQGAATDPELPIAEPGQPQRALITPNGTVIEVLPLRAAAPSANGAASTNANDIANAVAEALGDSTPNLKITVPNNTTELILAGPPGQIRLAQALIEQLDVAQKLVVLDTQIFEIDETAARNLGLSLTQPVISTTYSEVAPTAPPNSVSGSPPPFLGLLRFTRTPLSIGVTLNALIQHGNAKILSNPQITTISGRTASIRSGDNISILTTAGGSSGTVATTQLQTFQTGVSLDITPIVNAGDYISVTLHPTVNSLSGTQNGIPQISTRDTQTTVGMRAGQTLIIGGLIEDDVNTEEQKIPLLGDIPLIGHVFRNTTYNRTRNELVITVTPHIVEPGAAPLLPLGSTLPGFPLPEALPTPAPQVTLPAIPAPSGQGHAVVTTPPPVAKGRPVPTPSAFANANRFTYGAPPQSTFSAPSDAPQIFYVSFAPTVVSNGTPITLSAITTSNITKLVLTDPGISVSMNQTQPGFWTGSFKFDPVGIPLGTGRLALMLVGTKLDGSTSQVSIPISFAQ